jgi:hypothetical protein
MQTYAPLDIGLSIHSIIISHLSPWYKHRRLYIQETMNSTSTGPDGISNLHLKHLGLHGIQALTNICNYTHDHCLIPTFGNKAK